MYIAGETNSHISTPTNKEILDTLYQPLLGYTPTQTLTATITIAVADWDSGTTCTKTVSGVTATSFLTYAYSTDAVRETLIEFNVRPTGQDTDEITFTADSTPDAEIVLTVKIEEV
jgi:hypothetical protein